MAYRERQKISQMTPKGADLELTDLLEVSTIEGGSYVTKSITGEEIINAATGGALDLQAVTDNGNTTDIDIIVTDGIDSSNISTQGIVVTNGISGSYSAINYDGSISLKAGSESSGLANTNVTNANVMLEFPNKTAGSYTIATTSDLTSGLTVGTTAIASGTIGRVFFQGSGNVLQQSANLFWDNSNNALGLGASPLSTSRLDIRAKDALSTSQSFRIGRSTDNATQFGISGDGQVSITSSASNQIIISNTSQLRINVNSTGFFLRDGGGFGFSNSTSNLDVNASNPSGRIRIWAQASNSMILNIGGQDINPTIARKRAIISPVQSNSTLFSPSSGSAIDYSFETEGNTQFAPTSGTASYTQVQLRPTINTSGTYVGDVRGLYYNPSLTSFTGANHIAIETTTGNVIFGSTSGNVAIGGTSFGTSSDKVFAQYNGTAPGSSPTDSFQMYSADIVGGNAAPHFRTENGNIVKIYQETTAVASSTFVQNSGTRVDEVSTFDGYTIAQVVKALRNLGILA